jgi:hypothetical protein
MTVNIEYLLLLTSTHGESQMSSDHLFIGSISSEMHLHPKLQFSLFGET